MAENKRKIDVSVVTNTSDKTETMNSSDINNNKLIALLSYISILFLIPLFLAKDSKFARFHVNQGILLFIVSFILGLLSAIPFIGIVFKILNVVAFVFAILGIINAVQGKAKELPIIGKYTLIK